MFAQISVNEWSEAISISNLLHLKSPIWAFRGQADSTWTLKTTFEREGQKNNLDTYYYKTCESNIITDFQRQAFQYIQNIPPKDKFIDWLAYIQHYGGPTRLLDFTYSFYVAAFFSMKSIDFKPSIWCFNINNLISHQIEFKSLLFEKGYRETLNAYVEAANQNIASKQNFGTTQKKGNIYLVEPYNQEQRLGIQQGFFLFPTEIELTFEENLANSFGAKKGELSPSNLPSVNFDDLSSKQGQDIHCLQIVFEDQSVIYESINQLRSMNISSATLFPGLDGFAKSLNFHFHDMYWAINKPKL